MNILIGLLTALAVGVQAAEAPVSQKLSKQADIVLRAAKDKRGNGACDKYCWPTITIVKVFKNSSKEKLLPGGQLRLAFLSSSRPLPVGEFTVYLERYNKKDASLWKLLGGSTENGVSHVISSESNAPRTDCPAGTRPFTGLIGPGCCPDGAVCD